MPAAARAVADQTGDLGLMHCEDHPGRSAAATERVAHIGYVRNRRTVAAKLDRNLSAQKSFPARSVDGFPWEACLAVDGHGLRCRRFRDDSSPLWERGAVVRE